MSIYSVITPFLLSREPLESEGVWGILLYIAVAAYIHGSLSSNCYRKKIALVPSGILKSLSKNSDEKISVKIGSDNGSIFD